jgi:sarcosine oxidase subunit gamma
MTLGLSIADIACRSARRGQWRSRLAVPESKAPQAILTEEDARAALWLGPDEQLLLSSVGDGPALARQLEGALAALPHSLVDVSHRQIAFEVAGALAQTVLNAGCPLDLHPVSFPVGMCTRTVLGKADIVLWRTGADTFHVEVWRSFADYASRFLAEAAHELLG